MACVSGLTNGVYSYVDCCGFTRTGASVGEGICLDETYTGSSIGVYIATGQTCTINCNQGILDYSFSLTGVCSAATGTIQFNPIGGVPPYTIDNVFDPTISAQTGTTQITFSGLSGGTYVFRLNDSQGIQNNELYINVTVSGCFDAKIFNASGTTCGVNNGFLQVSAATSGSPYTILLYKNGVYDSTEVASVFPHNFTDLGNGIYNALVVDNGLATAYTENALISTSTAVDFGFWKVNTSNCVQNWGKLAVTGVTGTGPYTYSWSNGETSQIITGLTQGIYSCTVTDSLGCQTTKSETIGVADPLGLAFLTASQPTCFQNDGSLTFTITGGTLPFYYSATTGYVSYTLNNTFTLPNLSAGNYQVLVRDASYCEIFVGGNVITPGGFDAVSISTTNPVCNANGGAIQVTVGGANQSYVFTLSGQTSGNVQSENSQSQTYTFSNLQTDTYLVTISGSGSSCVYTEQVNVTSTPKFTISASTTGSTCGQLNGEAIITVSTGYTAPLDYILSNGDTLIDSPLSSVTYTDLAAGSYTISVTDADGCVVSTGFSITTGGNLITGIVTTNCTGANDGTAQVQIYDGAPPFTYNWSNGATGSTLTNLGEGNYTVTIVDGSGCTQTQNVLINCIGNLVSSYQTFNLCTNTFTTTSGGQRGLIEMLNEGYLDITSGYTGCSFNSAELICEIDINGSAFTQTFYTATTLNDVPQDTVWQSTIESILSNISQIQSYNIDLLNNTLTILSNCNGDDDPLGDADFTLGLEIVYDVTCSGYVYPPPTPTYSALFTSTSFSNVGGGLWPVSGVETGTISYSGAPNEILTMRMSLVNLINLSGWTSVNGINYNEYSANTFTASTNSSGVGTLNVISSATTFTGVYGQKLHYLEILNSSSGSTIGPPGTGSSFLRWRYTAPDFGSQNWIGGSSISATTSGDACNNITYNASYRLINTGATPNVGSTVYSGTTGTNLVNGNNRWISVYSAPVPTGLGYYSGYTYGTKYVIQINASGAITNVQTCP